MSRLWNRSVVVALSLMVLVGMAIVAPAGADEMVMTQGVPLPKREGSPFIASGLSSASAQFVAVDDYQTEEGDAARLAIHRISDGVLVRTIANPSPGGTTQPRLDGQSIIQLSESTYQGGIDTLTTTDVDSGSAAILSFDAGGNVVGYGPGWVLTCVAEGSTDNCPLRLRTAAGVNTLVGVVVNYSKKISTADGDETRAVVSTPSGDQWAINTITGSAHQLAYPEARTVAGGRAFWATDEFVDGEHRNRLHWRNLDGTDDGSVLVNAPSYEYDFRAFGDRVALLRVPEDGDFGHQELRPVNLTTGVLEPRVAHSITGLRSLADGKVVLALSDTSSGRIAVVGDDDQPPRTVFTRQPIDWKVDKLKLSGGQLMSTWQEARDADQELYFTTAQSPQPWSTTGPLGITGTVDHKAVDKAQYSGGVVLTDASGSGSSDDRTYKLAWPGGTRTLKSAFGAPALGNGGTLIGRNVDAGGWVKSIEVQSTESAEVKASLPGNRAFALDRTWIWSFSADGTILNGMDTASSAIRQHAFPQACSGRRLQVVDTSALVTCDDTAAFVLDLTTTSGSWAVPLVSGDLAVRLGGGYVTWVHYVSSGDRSVPVVKVASLLPGHETRTYGPARGLSLQPGPTLAPDDAGLPTMAYVDSRHQARLLDLSWTGSVAPQVALARVSPAVSAKPNANATFTFAGGDNESQVTYSVAYRTHGPSGFSAWVEPDAWSKLAGPSVTRKVASGTTVCFRVRAQDDFGRSSAWSASNCSTSPLDDRRLSAYGTVTRDSSASAMESTLSVMRKKGASLVRRGQRFHGVYVYAWRGPNEGSVKVYANTTYLGTISLKSSRSGYVRVLVKSSTARYADVRLVSSSIYRARIDGIALMP
ncbi:MAG: hypothetical protein H7290_07315 [Flavobacterium sp.]|nr:hypothetical protein [Aeromicrobium sp.]